MNGHFCNQITDRSSCCPVAHGAHEDYCTCKVSREMAYAVDTFLHERFLETYRQFDKETRQWFLRKHRSYEVEKSQIGPYTRVDCRLRSGSAKINEDGTCGICGEVVDWDKNAFDMKAHNY